MPENTPEAIAAFIDAKSIPCPATGCHIWTGALTAKGYPTMKLGRLPNQHPHRAAYELAKGPLPAGMYALHRCDLRCCVNPDHIFPGTKGDNNTDRARKGRNAVIVGTQRYNAKLNDDLVRQMRVSDLSDHYWSKRTGVSQAHINTVRAGKKWRHVLAERVG